MLSSVSHNSLLSISQSHFAVYGLRASDRNSHRCWDRLPPISIQDLEELPDLLVKGSYPLLHVTVAVIFELNLSQMTHHVNLLKAIPTQ